MTNSYPNKNDALSGKRVLVTGCAGFIGSHLVRKLIDMDCRVSLLLRQSSDLWRIQDIIDKTEVLHGDLCSLSIEKLQSKLSGVEVVYHLGAAGVDQSERDIPAMIQTNIQGTLSMLQLAYNLGVERFIYCGSCSEYGRGNALSENMLPLPNSEYGAAKLSGWILANMFHRKYGLPVVSLRPFMVYGPFEAMYRLIPHTILHALDGMDMKLTVGEQSRDFVYIEDAIEGFLRVATMPGIIGETFNLSTGVGTSVKDIVKMILELSGSAAKPLFGARPYRKSELWVSSGDNSNARNKLQWSPKISLSEGLNKTIRWFKDNRFRYSSLDK